MAAHHTDEAPSEELWQCYTSSNFAAGGWMEMSQVCSPTPHPVPLGMRGCGGWGWGGGLFLRQNWIAINFPSRRDEVKPTDKRALVPERLTSRRDRMVRECGRPATAAAVRKRSAEWSREGEGEEGGATSEG